MKICRDVTVDHDAKTIHVTANDDADSILPYVNLHDTGETRYYDMYLDFSGQ